MKRVVSIAFSAVSIVVCVFSIAKLMIFLSNVDNCVLYTKEKLHESRWDNDEAIFKILIKLATNYGLITIFIVQHSFVKHSAVKERFKQFGLENFHSSIYTMTTSLALLALVNYWQLVASHALWLVDAKTGVTWWIFTSIHLASWCCLYAGFLLMDATDILGVKQIYYTYLKLRAPSEYRPMELNLLYSHARHPCIIELSIILWTYPIMTLDRLLLAIVLTTYMKLAWHTDDRDLNYQKLQLLHKKATVYEKIKKT